jgi:hypothetical protein
MVFFGQPALSFSKRKGGSNCRPQLSFRVFFSAGLFFSKRKA